MGRYVEQLLGAARELPDGAGADWVALTNRTAPAPPDAPHLRYAPSGRPRRPTLAWLQLAAPHAIDRAGADVALMPSGRAPLRPGLPYVVTVHDLSVLRAPALYPRRERLLAAPWLRLAVHRAAAVVCVSAATRRELARTLPGVRAPVHVIHEAPDPMFGRPVEPRAAARVRQRYGLGPRVWLHVGAPAPRKNVPRLVEAFARARSRVGEPPPRLVLAGARGPGRAEVARLVRRLGLEAHVDLLDWVPEADLPALYAAAELAAAVALHEGFGLTALEALACGTPLLSSGRGALAEVAGDAALTADGVDVGALADGLMRLGSDAGLRATLAAAGRIRATRFDRERMARLTVAVCRRAALPRGPRRATMVRRATVPTRARE